MPRQKSLIGVIRDLVRTEVTQALDGFETLALANVATRLEALDDQTQEQFVS